jgi:hypothetical protein
MPDLDSFKVESKGILQDKPKKKQGAPRKKSSELTNKRIGLGLTGSEMKCFERHAKEQGLAPTAFARLLIKKSGYLDPGKDWIIEDTVFVSEIKCGKCNKPFPLDDFSPDAKMDIEKANKYVCDECT